MQLALDLTHLPEKTFDNYCHDNAASIYVEAIKSALITPTGSGAFQGVFLHGGSGVGKTHLLQAACHFAYARHETAVYVPLENYLTFTPEILSGLENMRLIAIDDVDSVEDSSVWQEALFHLYNRTLETDTMLLFAAKKPPKLLPFELADLQSRLSQSEIYAVQPLEEAARKTCLQSHIAEKGLEMTEETVEFLLKRVDRDLTSLFGLIDRLDRKSLAEQRAITIPFIKSVVGI